MILNDLEPPKGVFSKKFLQFLNAAHISTLNWDEMAGDRPRQPAYEILSMERRFQQSKSRIPRFKNAGTGVRRIRLPSLKVVILPLSARVA